MAIPWLKVLITYNFQPIEMTIDLKKIACSKPSPKGEGWVRGNIKKLFNFIKKEVNLNPPQQGRAKSKNFSTLQNSGGVIEIRNVYVV